MKITFHSYDNPTGRCAQCQEQSFGSFPRYCDEDDFRPLNQRIPLSQSAPDVDVYRNVCLGALQVESTTMTNWNAMEINFTEGIVLGLRNPLRLRSNSSCL